MEQETLILILGATIALVSSLMTAIVNHRLTMAKARFEEIAKTKEVNLQIKWDELQRDLQAVEQLVEMTTLVVREQYYVIELQHRLATAETKEEMRNVEILQQQAIKQVAQYSELFRQTYAKSVWRLYSLPNDIQNSYSEFDSLVKEFNNGLNTGGTVEIKRIVMAAGQLRTKIRTYVDQSRESLTQRN
ncbi:MAG TPA: hypothetical protein PLQ56_06825 [Aggregatilineales bacterium]|nr:hypothetical protein [Aggregatilineales bacterium]